MIQSSPASFVRVRTALADHSGKKFSMRSICALLLFCAFPGGLTRASDPPPAAANFYVAPNGKDSWSGKLAAPNAGNSDGPFASIAKAQVAVQGLIKSHPNRPIVVMLR